MVFPGKNPSEDREMQHGIRETVQMAPGRVGPVFPQAPMPGPSAPTADHAVPEPDSGVAAPPQVPDHADRPTDPDMAYVAAVAADKARETTEKTKISVAIAGEQREIEKNYRMIGEWFINEYDGELPEAVQELADAVAASKARIAELEEQKNAIKVEHSEVSAAEPGMKICPVCGAESDSKFCPKCGAPMD